MGIDLVAGGRKKVRGRKAPKTENPYVKLLVKLYRFLSRRTSSKFNDVVLKRLCGARRNKAPLSLLKLQQLTKGKENRIAAVVGTITDDVRIREDLSAIKVCALRFTETARARIEKAGGECMTFDQLALKAPKGNGVLLLRGGTKRRTAEKYFGKAPGVPGSTTRPKIRSEGRKFEMARGRRKSRGFKV